MTNKKTYVLTVSKNFMAKHHKAGKPTDFAKKIMAGEKIHTVRGNYKYWKKVIDKVNAGEAILSVRQWSGKPYNSKQVTFLEYSSLGYEKIKIKRTKKDFSVYTDKLFSEGSVDLLAKNDGLSREDFEAWFDKSMPKAIIIHFSDYRYGK